MNDVWIAESGYRALRNSECVDGVVVGERHASNGPTEAINGRLEALRRNALGFRNLTHYRLRLLLHSGALHHAINAL